VKRNLAVIQDDRRSPRIELAMAATIAAGPALTVSATVLNVSAHGIMVEVAVPLVPGRPVSVTMAGLQSRAGRIAWSRDGHAGVAFAQMLSVDELQGVIAE